MPDSKLDLKPPGSIRLMDLDTSTLFVPFGRPITEYLLGVTGNQNGTKSLLKQGAIDFSPAIRWKDSTAARLRTTGFDQLQREGLIEPAAAEPADPAHADFLAFEPPGAVSRDLNQARISPAIAPESLPVSLPRVSALPLRPRMTFGAAPAAKTKPAAAAPASKPAAATPKPATALAPKAAPQPIQTKPATAIPLAPKPAATPVPASKPAPAPASTRAAIPTAPAVRTPDPPAAGASVSPTPRSAPSPATRSTETAPPPPKASHTPARAPVSPARTQEAAISTLDAPPAAPVSKAPAGAPASPKPVEPPVPAGRAPSAAPAIEPLPPARPKPAMDAPALKPPAAVVEPTLFRNEPHLSMGDDAESRSFLDKVPLPAKIGIAILLILVAVYFIFAKPDNPGARSVMVGEQGWLTEWTSDAAGSRLGRQLTLYRPSVGLSDYRMQFTGQIESKALGWVFRAADTKNYYAMKIETLKPGAMALTHFAVVEGRESSSSQRPLSIDARPGAVYRVMLDVTGPRFTISIGGEPVDFWTDNRLKTGAVGFMNERDERGATSSVQFSFPQGVK